MVSSQIELFSLIASLSMGKNILRSTRFAKTGLGFGFFTHQGDITNLKLGSIAKLIVASLLVSSKKVVGRNIIITGEGEKRPRVSEPTG